MPESDISAFDDLLDRRLRGAEVDSAEFLRAHPELSEEQRRQVLHLCRAPTRNETPSVTAANPGAVPDDALPLIAGYRLKARIGAGGMGVVFTAEDVALEREVAIKILGPDLAGSGEHAERFLREVRAITRLHHPNIVTVHAAGEQNGLRYMVMEYIPGSNLHDLMAEAARRGARHGVAEVLRWGIEVARALQAAHTAGIIHRDVKPSNIRITPEGHAVLLDFGLARDLDSATLTESGVFRGSPQYASPEQVGLSGVPIEARTDVYSLGATLYEALTGVAPFRGETREQLFHQIMAGDPVPLRRLDRTLPRDLETVVLATLEKDVRGRHATAAALANDLEAVRDGRPVSVRPPSALGRLARWARRQPAKAALMAVAVLGIPLVAALVGYIVANLPKIDEAEEAARARELADLLQEGFLGCSEGDAASGRSVFEHARRLNPESAEVRAGYALSLYFDNDYAGALSFLDSPESRAGRSAWAGRIRSEALTRLGRKPEADALAKDVDPPSSAVDFLIIGLMQMKLVHAGSMKVAQDAFDNMRRANLRSHTAAYQFELGHAAWHAGRHKEARDIAAAIEHLWPDTPEREFAIARTLMGAEPDAALKLLEKAARDSPRSLLAREFITGHLAEAGGAERIDLAISVGLETVRRAPSRSMAHVVLAMAYQAKGDHKSAIRELEEGIRLRPLSATPRRELIKSLMAEGNLERAIAMGRETTKMMPQDTRSWNMFGLALKGHGDFDEAIKAFEEALRIEPDVPEIQFNLGNSFVKRGEFAKGLEQLRQAHERGSKTPQWKNTPSQRAVESAERFLRLEKRLDDIRSGAGSEPTPEERFVLAREVCVPKRRFAEAAALYAKGFSDDPTYMSQQSPHHLLDAASAAVAAGFGSGDDAPADPGERTRLRELARGWLDEEIRSCADLPASSSSTFAAIETALKPWTTAPQLAAVRSAEGLARLSPAESDGWRSLWARCNALIERRPESASSRMTK